MSKILTYRCTPQDEGQPLGHILRSRLGLTARQVKQVKFQPGGLQLNGQTHRDGRLITTRAAVRQGDQVRVAFHDKPETVVPAPGKLIILYEDEDLLFIDKPSGLAAHPAHGHYTDTLVNHLAARDPQPARLIGRLDKDTSGVICAARSSIAATRMEQQRKDGLLTLEGEGLIRQPLEEKRDGLLRMVCSPQGKPAITHYRVWHSWPGCSLVQLRLETGRTHQIRAHMAWLRHPLLGDSLYGQEGSGGFRRAALHSWRIQGIQPFTGAPLTVSALPPDDMKHRWEMEMMNEYKEYMERLTFPPEAVKALLEQMDAGMDTLAQRYMAGELTMAEALEALGPDYGRHMAFLVCCLPQLRRRYAQAGLPEELFWHTMMDLRYKLRECHEVRGCWGTFAGRWFDWFYQLKRFTLGRLQFEKVEYQEEAYTRAGVTFGPGDSVVNMHIPSAGPLTQESRLDAYRRAYEFYPECRKEGVLALVCYSWLLDPVYQTFLPESSNVAGFQRDFDIRYVKKKEVFTDAWRIFGAPGLEERHTPPQELPRDTSMQRAFADYLIAGGQTGTGHGIILIDENGIVPKQEV